MTGTNLIRFLMENNFVCSFPDKVDWKHGLIKTPAPDMHTIISVKNPYAWLVSCFNVFIHLNSDSSRCPNYIANGKNWTFDDFLINASYEWPNPIQRYNFSYNHWLEQAEFLTRTEDMFGEENQVAVLKEMQEKFQLEQKHELSGTTDKKPYWGPHFELDHYTSKKYLKHFTNNQLIFINSQLDRNLLGYRIELPMPKML